MHLDPPTSKIGPHTWEEFLELDEDDPRELVDGELVELEMPDEFHEHIVATLIIHLGNWARLHGAGRVLASGFKVRIKERSGFMPDVQFFKRENYPARGRDGLDGGHPDLAIEVISPKSSRSRDRGLKLRGYASIGVPEYWIVDHRARVLERYVLNAERLYVVADVLEDDAIFTPPSFAGLEIPLAELWVDPFAR
jgi:Uma2 family endonuclease